MVTTDPRGDTSRLAKERMIRVLDLVIYALVFLGGVFALTLTPQTIHDVLGHYEWLIVLWGSLLVGGGALGFLGRLTRFWAVETPGIMPSVAGSLIYAIVLGRVALDNATSLVAISLIAVAIVTLVRRYVELQILTVEPGDGTWIDRIRRAVTRRTPDVVHRYLD